jgi:hypothetical protein
MIPVAVTGLVIGHHLEDGVFAHGLVVLDVNHARCLKFDDLVSVNNHRRGAGDCLSGNVSFHSPGDSVKNRFIDRLVCAIYGGCESGECE